MPIVNFHLAEGHSTPAQQQALLLAASRLYAEVLDCPVDRVRGFITCHGAGQFAAAGEIIGAADADAPYFEFIVLEGRSLAQRQRLLAGFTDLLVDILGAARARVRGSCRRVHPEDWAIGGVPASVQRAAEIQARAEQAARP